MDTAFKNLAQSLEKSSKLEKILSRSVETGCKIQIVFQNPSQNAQNLSSRSIELNSLQNEQQNDEEINNTNDSDNNTVENNFVVSNFNVITKDLINVELDKSNSTADEDITDLKFNESTIEMKGDSPARIEYTIPAGLMELFDILPFQTRYISVPVNTDETVQKAMLDDGINVLNMSSNPTKKKRILLITRDLMPTNSKCYECDAVYASKCEFTDHKYEHVKGNTLFGDTPKYNCSKCTAVFCDEQYFARHSKIFHNVRRPIHCPKCNKHFPNTKHLAEHEEKFRGTKDCQYKCEKCNKSFITSRAFWIHIKNTKDAPCCNFIQCRICSYKFTMEMFVDHCQVHPNFVCEICGKSCISLKHLGSHKRFVHRRKTVVCDICGKVVKQANLSRHMEQAHSGQTISCNICSGVFNCKYNLYRHKKRVHGSPKSRFICELCGKIFTEKTSLNEHTKITHLKIKNYKCDICGQRFGRNDYLKNHMERHIGSYPYTCTICQLGYMRFSRLKIHNSIKHDLTVDGEQIKKKYKYEKGKMEQCHICNKRLSSHLSLKQHLRAHLKIRDYHCEKCGLTYQNKQSYQKHLNDHLRPNFEFKCNICHNQKSSRQELQDHLFMVHSNLKYKCSYCPKKFGRKYLQFSHESVDHKGEYSKRESALKILLNQQISPPLISTTTCEPRFGRIQKGFKFDHINVDIDNVVNTINNFDANQIDSLNAQEELNRIMMV